MDILHVLVCQYRYEMTIWACSEFDSWTGRRVVSLNKILCLDLPHSISTEMIVLTKYCCSLLFSQL